jgi:glucose/arabinose dehydrogenase
VGCTLGQVSAGPTATAVGSLPAAVDPAGTFRNEVLATGFDLPTAITFLPDGRMLVVQLEGVIKVLPPPYTTPSPTPFLQLSNVGNGGVQQGIFDIALDPQFATNHFYYLFYTMGSPNRDRLSRFTANAALTGTVAGSEKVLYQDPDDADSEHHGGAINFGNDGKIYFTTGEHFNPGLSQLLSSPRGKIHRINTDGTVPTDNPFYDGAGPNWDSVWARGLRNPYRAYYDAPTGRLLVGDVGGNDPDTAKEELDLGARGANYGWPDSEGPCSAPCTSPLYSYPHNGRDASITGGFVYHGSQFPASYKGSYFFADYAQNWIKRLTFNASGQVNGVVNFEPSDGSADGPTGDIVYLKEGPDGALYYVDLGYSDTTSTFGVSKIRRIRFISSNQAPVASASADPTSGLPPLTVDFSSAGSSDPEGQPLTYLWEFGDGTTSTDPNPTHTYTNAGPYSARLTVSDGVNSSFSAPISIEVGARPLPTITSPQDSATFRAADVISFSGDATDPEDGSLPDSAFAWNIDFLHEGHVHPGVPVVGTRSGSFTIPTSGHDFSGFTRYRVTLTVTDSDGLTASTSVTVFPEKVDLTFDTVPSGRTLYLDGIAKTTPFVHDTLIGFTHTVEARDQIAGTNAYTFASWSDGGAQTHDLVVPDSPQSYTASFSVSSVTSTTMSAPTVLTYGSAAAVTIALRKPQPVPGTMFAGKTETLYWRRHGTTAWTRLGTVLITPTGGHATLKPLATMDVLAYFPGAPGYRASSATRVIAVAPKVVAKLSATSVVRRHSVTISGSVAPQHAGQPVYLQRYYSGAWHTLTSRALTSSSTFAFGFTPATSGTYLLRVYKTADSDHAAAATGTLTLHAT